jgi:hypothetical protein
MKEYNPAMVVNIYTKNMVDSRPFTVYSLKFTVSLVSPHFIRNLIGIKRDYSGNHISTALRGCGRWSCASGFCDGFLPFGN